MGAFLQGEGIDYFTYKSVILSILVSSVIKRDSMVNVHVLIFYIYK